MAKDYFLSREIDFSTLQEAYVKIIHLISEKREKNIKNYFVLIDGELCCRKSDVKIKFNYILDNTYHVPKE